MAGSNVSDVFRLVGTTLEGRFTIQRTVAEGGFGVVYYAQQAALERPIALKVLKTPQYGRQVVTNRPSRYALGPTARLDLARFLGFLTR